MKNNPEISVIIPFYNAEKTFENAINSILQQTFTNFELILIDNNSTDQSLKIAQEKAKQDSRIILLEERQQGVVFASNKGLQQAKGKYVARTDADDISHKEKLFLQYKFLEKNSDFGLIGTCVNYCGSDNNLGFKTFVDYTNSITSYEDIYQNQFVELLIANPTIMFRKTVAEKYGFYKDGNFPEDYELFLRWLNKGVKFAKLPEKLLDWHDSETRLTRTDKRYSVQAFYETKTPYLVDFLKKNKPYFPKVVIWGAGRTSVRRSNLLKKYGIEIDFYIDVKIKKESPKKVIFYEEIPEAGKYFILSYAGSRGAREQIVKFLLSKKYKQGKDFLIVS